MWWAIAASCNLTKFGTLAALKVRRSEVLKPAVSQHLGRVVKFMGDGVLVEFHSAVDAVECAVRLQEAMDTANSGLPEDKRIVLRIGINLGDVVVEGTDLYGDGVNVAARLEALAEPGCVYISHSVYSQVRGKVQLNFDDLGEKSLKNMPEPVRVFRVSTAGAPKVGAQSKDAKTPSAIDPPSLFNLFMNDLKSAKGMCWDAFSDVNINNREQNVRIFYKIIDDFNANSKFLSFYVPKISVAGSEPGTQSLAILQFIAGHYQEYVSDIQKNMWAETKALGDTATYFHTDDCVFRARVPLSCRHVDRGTTGVADAALSRKWSQPAVQGNRLRDGAWNAIRLGDAKAPPHYEIHNNMPRLAPISKGQGAA